ncbi:MAG: murein biosynthesis integral membrane protein MurJ [Syntrophomonadaceae bacterium]|nr:murein biosynthesis integral membrane protein MurJ [Syntrophomonadaceae bacterium]
MSNGLQKTGKTFIGVSAVIFISKVIGFARDIVFASIFGTAVLADLFQVIFSFPGYLFASVGTALSSFNIPDLTYFINNRTREERNQYLSNLFAQITLWATLLSLLGIVFAPALTRLIAPGISGEAEELAVLLTRIMIPTLLFVSLTYVAAGVLQVHGYFLLSSSISVPFNILIIGSLLLKGDDIVLLGYVTTIGWLLQFLIQTPVLIKEKYHFSLRINFKDEHTVLLFKGLIPILLGNSLLQLCLIIDRSFAYNLDVGTTSALAFGSNLFITVTSIFIVAMSTVVFPRLSQYCMDGDMARIRMLLQNIFKILLFILLPYLLLVIFYNHEIVSLVYERGAFTGKSTDTTALAFLGYSFAVLGYACQEIFNRVYYALKKFKIPAQVSILCLMLKLLLDLLLFRTAGIAGISISTAVCLLVYALVMGVLLHREIGSFLGRDLLYFIFQLGFPLAGMASVVLAGRYLGLAGRLTFLLPLLVSGLVYLGTAYLSPVRHSILGLKES